MIGPAFPPPAAVKSVDEVLAIAQTLEREAAARYAMLADCMRRVDQHEIAALLDELAAEERAHVEGVERLAQQIMHRPPERSLVRRELPKTFGDADEANAAALMSPYRVLSIAVRSEERAFAFWTYLAAQAGDASVRRLAETFARQELIHAAKLRRARRRSYHAERGRLPRTRRAADERTPADIRAEAAALESAFAAFSLAAAGRLRAGGDDVTAGLFESLADDAGRAAAALSAVGRETAQPGVRYAEPHGTSAAALLFEAVGMMEDIDYRYLDWLRAASSESLVRELEARAQATASRLARINEALYALEPSLRAMGKA